MLRWRYIADGPKAKRAGVCRDAGDCELEFTRQLEAGACMHAQISRRNKKVHSRGCRASRHHVRPPKKSSHASYAYGVKAVAGSTGYRGRLHVNVRVDKVNETCRDCRCLGVPRVATSHALACVIAYCACWSRPESVPTPGSRLSAAGGQLVLVHFSAQALRYVHVLQA